MTPSSLKDCQAHKNVITADANEDLLMRNPNHEAGTWPSENGGDEDEEDEDDAEDLGRDKGKQTQEDEEMDNVEALMAGVTIEETDKVSTGAKSGWEGGD